MNKHRLKNKEMILKLAQPKERRSRMFPPKSYNDRSGNGRNSGGSRYGNGNYPLYNNQSGPTTVVSMSGIIGGGLPMGPVSHQQQTHHLQSGYLKSNCSVPGYGITQANASIQMPYNTQVLNSQTAPQFILATPMQVIFLVRLANFFLNNKIHIKKFNLNIFLSVPRFIFFYYFTEAYIFECRLTKSKIFIYQFINLFRFN